MKIFLLLLGLVVLGDDSNDIFPEPMPKLPKLVEPVPADAKPEVKPGVKPAARTYAPVPVRRGWFRRRR